MKFYYRLQITITILAFFTACSTSSIQSKRLNTVEELIIQTEQHLTGSSGDINKIKAQEKLGVAKAYLSTLKDYNKSLTKQELERYERLTKESDSLSKRAGL